MERPYLNILIGQLVNHILTIKAWISQLFTNGFFVKSTGFQEGIMVFYFVWVLNVTS